MRLCFITLAFSAVLAANAQDQDLTKEIKRLRRELMQVQQERERVTEEKEKDESDFREYRKRTRTRMRDIRRETDSIAEESIVLQAQRDSIAALVNAQQARKKQYELLRESYRGDLLTATKRVVKFAQTLPPGVADKSLSALALLENELSTKIVDNTEAATRLFQIIGDMHEAAGVIQIVQSNSPVPSIRGVVYQIRLGLFFHAAVDAKGTKAAVWTGWDENDAPQWELIDDPAIASNILQAINVREGKSLPSLVRLPLDDIEVARDMPEEDREEPSNQ